MISKICREIHHWFVVEKYNTKHKTINNECKFEIPMLLVDYEDKATDTICINEKIFNAGEWQPIIEGEKVIGIQLFAEMPKRNGKGIFFLDIPCDFLELVENIKDYANKETGTYISESFGGWSGTKATGKNGVLTWQEKFRDELKPYRRMFTDLQVCYDK